MEAPKRFKDSELSEYSIKPALSCAQSEVANQEIPKMEVGQNAQNTPILTPKERSKLHRDRKKAYLKNLEKENERLREEVLELKSENIALKEKMSNSTKALSADSSTHSDPTSNKPKESTYDLLKREEEFKYCKLPELILKDPTKVTYSMLNQSRENIGPYGKYRVQYLKECFDNILENIFSFDQKMPLYNFDKIPMNKWLRLQKAKRKKFTKMADSDKQVLDKMVMLSEECIKYMEENGKELLRHLHEVRRWARKLVYNRNKLLKSMKALSNSVSKSKGGENIFPWSKLDVAKLATFMASTRKNGQMDKFTMFKISKRDPDKEYGSEIELSE